MSHTWTANATSVGQLTPANISSMLAERNADLACSGLTATPEDEALWTALLAQTTAVITAIDPAGTATVRTQFRTAGLHAGFESSSAHLFIRFRQTALTTSEHFWQCQMAGPLSVEEIALGRTHAQAQVAGGFASSDTTVFNALIATSQALIAALDATSTGIAIQTAISAQVATDLSVVNLNVNVSLAHPNPAATIITPAPFSADQNDYSPAGLATATVLRASCVGSRKITGIVAPSPIDARQLIIYNVGTNTITLNNESLLSAAANRIVSSANITMAPNKGAILTYDPISARWRVAAVV